MKFFIKIVKSFYHRLIRIFSYYFQFFNNTIIYCNNSLAKQLALTFDDGPHKIYTPQVLSILSKYNIKATFFLRGDCIESSPDIVKEIFNQKHTIGNHSFGHTSFNSLSSEAILASLNRTDKLIKDLTGIKKNIYYRPPFRISTSFYSEWLKKSHKYNVSWSLDSFDHIDGISPDEIIAHIIKNIKNGDVIIFHDNNEVTCKTLNKLLPELTKLKYTFINFNN